MAKDKTSVETVEVPLGVLQELQQRLAALEYAQRLTTEAVMNPRAKILDREYEAWKAEAGRTARERTQDLADARYGTTAPRFRVRLDSTGEDGKKGPHIDEHPELVLSANSDLEAQARYLALCGIRKHDYRVACEPVEPESQAA